MRVVSILMQRMEPRLQGMHAARRRALSRAVQALLGGGKLWLTALGRSLPGACLRKHAIKSVDRLLGNGALWRERLDVYGAIVASLRTAPHTPIILVDVTAISGRKCALQASLAYQGRSVPILSLVRSKTSIFKRRTQQQFLRQLATVLRPDDCPVLITDAGFESPWFEEVEARGWHYIGRVRRRTKFRVGEAWLSAVELHQRAVHRAKNLGMLAFPKCAPKPRRMVLSKRRTKGRRRRLTTKGKTSGSRSSY